MRLQIFLRQGEEVPRGYGRAWNDYNRDGAICYPVPLNVLFGWSRLVWVWLRFRSVPTQWDTIRQAYQAGHLAGRQAEIRSGGFGPPLSHHHPLCLYADCEGCT